MNRIPHFSIALLTVFIAARAQAQSPGLSIDFYSPTNSATVKTPVPLKVAAGENAHTVLTVEFFANGQSIGLVTNNPIFQPPDGGIIITRVGAPPLPDPILFVFNPFILSWNPEPGEYTLTARVTDDQGNSADSAPVNVTTIPMPLVSVEAIEPTASPNGLGIFTITRTGFTNSDLQVPFFLLGTAKNGVDYTEVSNSVTIPAGQVSTDIDINPLAYRRGNSRTVNLQLWNYLVPGGGGPGPAPLVILEDPPFLLGSPSQATVYIKASDRDRHKPKVKITLPGNKAVYAGPANITIWADTVDRDTGVALVEFFDGTTKLGESRATASATPKQHVLFNFNWNNVPAGPHVLHALATDTQGAQQVSAPIQIDVLSAQ